MTEQRTAEPRMLRLEEVASRLGISYQHVRQLVLYDEAIPHFKVGSRGIRVKEDDLNKYIAGLEQSKKKEEVPSGKDKGTGTGAHDTRETYPGRGALSSTQRRDKPPGA